MFLLKLPFYYLLGFYVMNNLSVYSQLMPDGSVGGGVGNLPAAAPLSATGIRKAWHEHVTQDLRTHLVHKL